MTRIEQIIDILNEQMPLVEQSFNRLPFVSEEYRKGYFSGIAYVMRALRIANGERLEDVINE